MRDDDAEHAALCRSALISIESMYEGYLPRLLERMKEEAEKGDEIRYVLHISQMLLAEAANELGVDHESISPMDSEFFTPCREV